MIVTAHDHSRGHTVGEIPKAWQRLLSKVHLQNEIGEKPLLFVGLWDGDFVKIDPVGFRVTSSGTKEQIISADGAETIAVEPRPRRITLTCVHDGSRQVVRKRNRLPVPYGT